jgi:hypothetical protein
MSLQDEHLPALNLDIILEIAGYFPISIRRLLCGINRDFYQAISGEPLDIQKQSVEIHLSGERLAGLFTHWDSGLAIRLAGTGRALIEMLEYMFDTDDSVSFARVYLLFSMEQIKNMPRHPMCVINRPMRKEPSEEMAMNSRAKSDRFFLEILKQSGRFTAEDFDRCMDTGKIESFKYMCENPDLGVPFSLDKFGVPDCVNVQFLDYMGELGYSASDISTHNIKNIAIGIFCSMQYASVNISSDQITPLIYFTMTDLAEFMVAVVSRGIMPKQEITRMCWYQRVSRARNPPEVYYDILARHLVRLGWTD